MATGDASGTWGTVTNTNLELIGEALGFGTRAIANASTDNITIADGASDSDRAMYLKLTGGGQACTVTLLPNTVSKLWFMENGTNSALTFTQGSGANVIIPAGDTKLIASNGGGSGAIVYDVFASLSVVDLKVQDDLTVTDDATIGGALTVTGIMKTDDATDATSTTDGSLQTDGGLSVAKDAIIGNDLKLLSDSAVLVFGAGSDATLTHTNDTGLTLNSTNKLMFNDASQFIQGSSATVLSLGATDEIDLTATEVELNVTTFDVNGAMTISGDTTLEDGADIITASAGNNNTRIGTNAGFSIASGGNSNVCIGDEAGRSLTTGDNNIAIGHEALYSENAHGQNIAIGYRSLKALDAGAEVQNTAIGYLAGQAIDLGRENVLVGGNAGDALTHADYNVAIGNGSLGADTLGHKSTAVGYATLNAQNFTSSTDSNNTAVGYFAGVAVTTGVNNTLIGSLAGDALTEGGNNTALGIRSLGADTLGSRNTAIGYNTLLVQNFASATNSYNVAMGHDAGRAITTGIFNTLIGSLAGDALSDADTNVAIGASALTTDTLGSKSTAVGHSALEAQNFASATTTHNTAVGADSGKAISTGTTNSTFGSSSGAALTTGTHNVLIGSYAGAGGVGNLTTGLRNILIGHGAGQNNGNDNGNIAIGYETNCQGHAEAIVLGGNVDSVANTTFTFGRNDGSDRVHNNYTSNATFTRVSDERYKKEIQNNTDCGLDFINELRTVTFKFKAKSEIPNTLPDYDASKTTADHTGKLYGMIAQEVKAAMATHNITDFGGHSEEESSGIQGVAQSMFIYPLIKAVQELSAQVTALTARVTELEG